MRSIRKDRSSLNKLHIYYTSKLDLCLEGSIIEV
nr:MAG TPA: hypothetical protein [Caudoviricetes sp.]